MTSLNYKLLACTYCQVGFKSLRKRKYCSTRCSVEANNRRAGHRPLSDYNASRRNDAHYFKCERCGKDSYRTLSGTNPGGNRFCSMTCRTEHMTFHREGPSCSVTFANCKQCFRGFARQRNEAWCSVHCRREYARAMARLMAAINASRVVACKGCGAEYCNLPKYGMVKYCPSCALVMRRAAAYVYKRLRRGLERAAVIELVDPYVVFDKANWHCELCFRPTPKDLRGTVHPTAPELDHVVPISKGGPHCYANLQCLCRRCNGLKSNKIFPRWSEVYSETK